MNYPLQAPFAPVPGKPGSGGSRQYKSWHDTLIDYLLMRPDMKLSEIAQQLGRNPQSVSYVMKSDIFKARLAMRRAEHSERISNTIISQAQRMATQSLALLNERLADDSVARRISPRDLHEIAKDALDRIGLGKKESDVVIQTHIHNGNSVTVNAEVLGRARMRLRENEALLIEGSPQPSVGAGDEISLVPPAKQSPATEFEGELPKAAAPPVSIFEELMKIGDEDEGSAP